MIIRFLLKGKVHTVLYSTVHDLNQTHVEPCESVQNGVGFNDFYVGNHIENIGDKLVTDEYFCYSARFQDHSLAPDPFERPFVGFRSVRRSSTVFV